MHTDWLRVVAEQKNANDHAQFVPREVYRQNMSRQISGYVGTDTDTVSCSEAWVHVRVHSPLESVAIADRSISPDSQSSIRVKQCVADVNKVSISLIILCARIPLLTYKSTYLRKLLFWPVLSFIQITSLNVNYDCEKLISCFKFWECIQINAYK